MASKKTRPPSAEELAQDARQVDAARVDRIRAAARNAVCDALRARGASDTVSPTIMVDTDRGKVIAVVTATFPIEVFTEDPAQ